MRKKQIVVIGVAILLIAVYVGIKIYASSVAEKKINIAIAKIANYADVDYKNVWVDLFGLNVHISDVVVSPADSKDKVKINEIVIYDIDKKSDIPLFLDVSFRGIEIDINQLGSDAKKIKQLGYGDKILLNFDIKYYYNQKNKEINIDRFKIGADDVGDLNVSFRLGNIDLSPEKIVTLIFTYPQIILYNAKISYHDDSLIERIMKLAAKEQKKEVKQLKNEIMKDIEGEIVKTEDKFIQNALKELKDFIEDPEELTISIAPQKPLPVGRLLRVNDPKDIIELLNMKISS